MARLEGWSTADLWGMKQSSVHVAASRYPALSFYKLGLGYMKKKNKDILSGITLSDLENNSYLKELFMARLKTIDHYQNRIEDLSRES